MPLPDGLHLRDADETDLPRIAEMREQVGWGVHDWALRAVIDPVRARCVVVADDERIVAVGSGISYGPLGVVGNMIVDADHRRRGLGSAVLEAVTAFLASRGALRQELYATADGRGLYARHGFEDAGPSVVARVRREHVADHGVDDVRLEEAGPSALAEVAAFDRPRFGGDRSALLEMMLADAERPFVVARRPREIVGYAWLRPDAERIGPLVADAPDLAVTLLAEAFRRLPETALIGLNLPPGNRDGADRLRDLGAEIEEWDGRMARGPRIPRREETIYGNTVGALG